MTTPMGSRSFCWYKRDTGTGVDTILSFEDVSGTYRWTLAILADESVQAIGKDAGDATEGEMTSNTAVTAVGAWEHLGIAYNPSSTTGRLVVVDGSSQTIATNTVAAEDITVNLDTGFLAARETGTDAWDGPLSEVVVVTGMLTLTQIQEAYNSGTPIDPRSLSFGSRVVSHWIASKAEYVATDDLLAFRNIAPILNQTWGYADAIGVDSTNIDTDVP